jgi:thiol:disulfide interchange protein DsbD
MLTAPQSWARSSFTGPVGRESAWCYLPPVRAFGLGIGCIGGLILALAGACGSKSPGEGARTAADESAAADDTEPVVQPVRAYLLSDVSHVAAGQEFSLGVRLDIEPTWHIYWINPGETGLPTETKFEVPKGFSSGEVRYPGPARFESPGGIVSYGYEGVTVISVPVVAPDSLAAGDRLRFVVEVSWLACREACIPGSSSNEMRLDVAAARAPSEPANVKLWTDHLARLPMPWSELTSASFAWLRDAKQLVLELTVPGAQRVEYFPSTVEQTLITGQAAIPSEDGVALRISFRDNHKVPPPEASRGLVRVVAKDVARYYNVDIPWPKEK